MDDLRHMTTHAGLPVAGYQPQSDDKVLLANEGKALEERYLRWLDKLGDHTDGPSPVCDARFIALARTHIQTGAMFAIRSIFQPTRIALPEDESKAT